MTRDIMTDWIRFPKAPVALAHLSPVAKGQDRHVYYAEAYPDLLFKAPQPLSVALNLPEGTKPRLTFHDLRNFRRLALILAPKTLQRPFYKESSVYLGTRLRGAGGDDLPISNLFGFCDSDLGPVMAVERIACPGQLLGTTLRQIVSKGEMTPERIELLNIFAAQMFTFRVIAGDMTAANIVLGHRNGKERFVLIDGFGDIHAIPIRSAWWRLNQIALTRSFTKMAGRIGLPFDPETRRFSPA